MKVIGGTARGMNLSPVPGTTTRPITARVKKALFDILGEAIPGSRFLDLFAGSGSVGIEALSRGADECVFVEKSARAVATIRRNLRTTGLDARAQVLRDDAFRYVGRQCSGTFDIVYIAPPQYQNLWAEALLALDCSSLVEDDGIGFGALPRTHPSLGHASMRERIRIVRGTLDIESAPGRGTTVRAWAPYKGDTL